MNVVIANNGQQAVNQWLAVDRGFYTIAIFDHVSVPFFFFYVHVEGDVCSGFV